MAPRLRSGDRVRLVSPASPPERHQVAYGARLLESWGLRVEIGAHAFDTHGHFLAGRDEDRLADFNDALRDPGVRAIFSTRGGKGAYRIAHAPRFRGCRSRSEAADRVQRHHDSAPGALAALPAGVLPRASRRLGSPPLWRRCRRAIAARVDGTGAAHDPPRRA